MKILFDCDVQIRFDPHDCWIGVYWKRQHFDSRVTTTLFICVVPMIVIRVRRDRYGK